MRHGGMRIPGLILGLALILSPTVLEAQVEPPRQGMGRQREQLEHQLRLRFREMIKARLNLSDETLVGMHEVMESFQVERLELGRAQASVRHRLRDAGLAALSDEEAMALLQEMVRLQERELELYRREQEELLTLLSPSQLVRFYALREELSRRVMELRGRRGRGGVGPPGGGIGGEPPADAPWKSMLLPIR